MEEITANLYIDRKTSSQEEIMLQKTRRRDAEAMSLNRRKGTGSCHKSEQTQDGINSLSILTRIRDAGR